MVEEREYQKNKQPETLHDSFDRINKLREIQKDADREVEKQNSHLRLQEAVKKKLTTTFIGALDSFETGFGYLWAHGVPFNELTENQKEFRELWADIRNEILNKSNAQLRNVLAELDEYETVWLGKKYIIQLTNKND